METSGGVPSLKKSESFQSSRHLSSVMYGGSPSASAKKLSISSSGASNTKASATQTMSAVRSSLFIAST